MTEDRTTSSERKERKDLVVTVNVGNGRTVQVQVRPGVRELMDLKSKYTPRQVSNRNDYVLSGTQQKCKAQ